MAASSSESGTVYESSSTRQHDRPAIRRMRTHDIFLSHSGAQKGFVEELYNMLHPQYVTFFDIKHHSLPLTERFPDHIFDAARTCNLAVVVLSNEFLSSKWPMMELCAFVEAQSVKILPLFYKLSPTDLKDEDRLKEWLQAWEGHAKHDRSGRIKVPSWKEALRKLCSLNGLVKQGKSKQSYLQEIVSSISLEILTRVAKYEESGIQGKDRLCKIILDKFEGLEFKQPTTSQQSTLPPHKKIHVLGMHGPSGSGKSTLSRCFYEKVRANFKGKTAYLELPTNPSVANLVQACKDLLSDLTNGFYSAVQLARVSNLREMYHLFKVSNLQGFEVFLMLDNVSADKDSIELVQVILRLCFGRGSKVLLVARTYNVLRQCQDNLAEYYVCDTIRVPSLNEEEAITVLLQRGGGVGWDTSDGPEKDLTPRYKEIMEKVVRMSGFGDPENDELLHLPLVLEIMGHSLRESRLDHVVEWGMKMDSFWRKIEVCKQDAVRRLVQESFGKLSLELQLLFLDLALFYLPVYGRCIEDACSLISLMHECSPEAIESQMYSLERSCFLSMHSERVGRFRVHDVFLEFAASIPESSKYYFSHEHQLRNIHAKGADEGGPRNQLQAKCDVRVIVLELGEECTTRLDFPVGFSSVKILSVRNSKSLGVLGMAGLTSLVSLEIVNCPSIEWMQSGDVQNLRRFRWSNDQENIYVSGGQWWQYLLQYPQCLFRMIKEGRQWYRIGAGGLTSEFRCLQALTLQNTGIRRLEDVSRCWPQLEDLQVCEKHLEHFEVGNLPKLKRFLFSDCGDFDVLRDDSYTLTWDSRIRTWDSRMTLSRENLMAQCPELEEVRICSNAFKRGIGILPSTKLRTLFIRNVPVEVMVLDHASLAPSLKKLIVTQCGELTSLNFECQFAALSKLTLCDCPSLAKLTGLHRLSNLQRICIARCFNLAEIHGLEGLTSLQTLSLDCTNLVEIHGLEGLTSLQKLSVECTNLVEIHGLEGLTSLQKLYIWDCTNLAEIHGLEGLTSLQELQFSRCTNLAEIHGLEGLISLHELAIRNCTNLIEIHGLEGLTSLQELYIKECTNLAEIHGLEGLTSLQKLDIQECTNLADIHALEGLTSLQELYIQECTNLAEIHGLEGLTRLQKLDIQECTNLANIHGLEGLTSLQKFKILECTNLAEIHGLEGLTNLQKLQIAECTNLAEIHGLEGLTSLQKLKIRKCTNLAEIHGLEGLTNL